MKRGLKYSGISGAVYMAKVACNISSENKDLTDDEIAEVCRHIASYAPDTVCVNGKPQFGEIGISLMLSIALYEFPWFYQKHELWQRN